MQIFIIQEYEIYIDPLLSFTVKCFAWSLPDNHPVSMEHNKFFNNITVSNIISLLNNYKLCAGVKMFASGIIPHVILKVYDVIEIIKSPIQQKKFYRSSNCNLLLLGMIYPVIVMQFKINKIKTKVRKSHVSQQS